MPDTPYPDVPDLPGVPPIPRDPQAPNQDDTPTTVVVTGGRAAPKVEWAIYNSEGNFAIEPDSFGSLDYKKPYSVPDYPIELGSFESYNKVERPFQGGIRLTKGGDEDARKAFIVKLDELNASLDMFVIVTPERTYLDVNFIDLSYRRSVEQGATLIIADLLYTQIRSTASQTFSSTASPSGASPTDTGNKQAREPSAAQEDAFYANGGVG